MAKGWQEMSERERNAWLYERLEGARWYVPAVAEGHPALTRFLAVPTPCMARLVREARGDEPLYDLWDDFAPKYTTDFAVAFAIGARLAELGLGGQYGGHLSALLRRGEGEGGGFVTAFALAQAPPAARAEAAYLTLTGDDS